MTRDEFINMLKDNLEPNTEMDFLLVGRLNNEKLVTAFLDIHDINMNADIDDLDNKNRGGIVFKIKEDLSVE